MEENNPAKKSPSLLANIFFSPSERRLRTSWRLLIHFFILLILLTIFEIIIGFIIAVGQTPVSATLQLMLGVLISSIAITISIYIARVYLDQRTFTSLGLNWNLDALSDLFAGFAISLLIVLVIFLSMWLLGWIRILGFAWQNTSTTWISNLFYYFIFMSFVAWGEELLARGYWLQNLSDGLNLIWGVIISSALFSIFHLTNPGSTWFSAIGIFLAGMFLAYGYLVTRKLWFPIGLHLGWNFFLGPIFGFAVSGLEFEHLVNLSIQGPDLITGGSFGPEAGLIIIPALLIGTSLIFIYSRQQKKRFGSKNIE